MVKLQIMDYELWLDYIGNYEFLQKKLKLLFDTNIDILKQKKYFQSFCRAWMRRYKIKITTSGSHTVGIMMDDYRKQVSLV